MSDINYYASNNIVLCCFISKKKRKEFWLKPPLAEKVQKGIFHYNVFTGHFAVIKFIVKTAAGKTKSKNFDVKRNVLKFG